MYDENEYNWFKVSNKNEDKIQIRHILFLYNNLTYVLNRDNPNKSYLSNDFPENYNTEWLNVSK